MHTSFRALSSLALATIVQAQSQYLANDISFGHSGRVSPDLKTIPNFKLLGEPNTPEVLSNKIILTPPAPGNQRGAIWAEKNLLHQQWTTDVEFRASGPERGGGNLQIWYTKDGQQNVGTSSLYTAGKFDGLALVIDTYGGSGGTIRGFLNDGNTDYKTHHSVDSLAFGHCQYSYRNLGRPSQIKIRQSSSTFKVEIDGKPCFESPNIQLPVGYSFGITAASPENPDSFEVFKMVVTTDSATPESLNDRQEAFRQAYDPRDSQPIQQDQQQQQQQQQVVQPEDVPAESISQDQQFADLHNRLQKLMKAISMVQRDLNQYQGHAGERYSELKAMREFPYEQINAMDNRLSNIERSIDEIKKNTIGNKEYKKHLDELRKTLKDSHSTLMEGLPTSLHEVVSGNAPRMGLFLFLVLGFQAALAGLYVVYKRRRGMAPKKYL